MKASNIKVSKLYWIILAGYILLQMIGSRTGFFGNIIFLAFIYYSLNRSNFKWKSVLKIGLILTISIIFIFPAVNIYRNSVRILGVKAVNNGILENLDILVSESINNYHQMSNEAQKAVSTRSVGVFQAFALAIIKDTEPRLGVLTLNSISIAIPKVIYPLKSTTGSQLIIEKELGVNSDTADSLLLFSKMEWGNLGAIFCLLMYLFLFIFWDFLNRLFIKIFKHDHLLIFSLISVFGISQYIEMSPDTLTANLIQSPVIITSLWILLWLLNKRFAIGTAE
jgi:hypothetical protein